MANTKVEIESEGHEVFVREIASSANLKCAVLNGFAFIFEHDTEDAGREITIPLPPKEPEPKEWPVVGDDVLICKDVNLFELGRFNGKQCKVIGICEHNNEKVLTLSNKNCGLIAVNMGEWIKKPLTPEEELEKELKEIASFGMIQGFNLEEKCCHIVSGLIKKYDIKKKPEWGYIVILPSFSTSIGSLACWYTGA